MQKFCFIALIIMSLSQVSHGQTLVNFEYTGPRDTIDLTQIVDSTADYFDDFMEVGFQLQNDQALIEVAEVVEHRAVVPYPDGFGTYLFKFVPGFGANRYQIVQRYENGSRRAVYFLDRKGRRNGYITIFNPDGTYAFVGHYRHGKRSRDWREKDYLKLQDNIEGLNEGEMDGLYTSISRYGSIYLKLDKDKKCRYYGYDQNGKYINQYGTWSVNGRFVVLKGNGEDGSSTEAFARFLFDGPKTCIQVQTGKYWDPDFKFEKG